MLDKRFILPVAAILAVAAVPVAAAEKVACGRDLICASKPETVVKGLQEAGYKAKLVTPDDGDHYVETSMNGYFVDVVFSDCDKKKDCKSLSFRLSFVEDPFYTAEVANNWNKAYRFMQVYRTDSGAMGMNFDVSTVGGLNQANFSDVCQVFDTQLGAFDKFLDNARTEQEAVAAKPEAAAPSATP